jgi:L-amino acid N-acyltransferase YncA
MIAVRDATAADIPAITEIQNALIASTSYEWREDLHTVDSRIEWLDEKQRGGWPVVVGVDESSGEVVGFAYYGDFRDSTRWPGYRTTVEHTIHVRGDQWGRGVGRHLLGELEHRARAQGKHVMVGGIDATNEGSLLFHTRLGYQEVARMPQVGVKFGRWLELVLVQKVLDDGAADGR